MTDSNNYDPNQFARTALPENILSDYHIKRFDETLSAQWDDFVENRSINGTFLHTRKFYNHNPLNERDDHSFLFYKRSRLIGILGCSLPDENNKVLISHPRATYGGFVVDKNVGVEASLAMVQLLVQEAKAQSINEIIIKNTFRIFHKKPCDEFDYALWYYGFDVKYRELEVAIPLDADLTSGYTEGTRSGLHKALKTLVVELSSDYEVFWQLLEKTLKERYKAAPTHSYSQFCVLLNTIGEDKIKLFVTKKEDQIIAGVVLFILNNVCVHAQYIAYNVEFQNSRPLNILLHQVSVWAQEKGYKYFNLGRANEDNGNKVNFNLFKFKESYGGRSVLRETLSLKL